MSPMSILAFINLVRNRRRTLLTLLPTAAGLAALLLLWSVNEALQRNITENFQDDLVGSIQIHHQGFFAHPKLTTNLGDAGEVIQAVSDAGINVWTQRLESFVLAAGHGASTGLMLIALDPERETRVTHLQQQVGEGRFLLQSDTNTCLLGEGAARNLNVTVGDSIDVIANDRFGAPVGDSFKVAGILHGGGYGVDRDIVFVPLAAAQVLLDMEGASTNVVLRVPRKKLDKVTRQLRQALPEDQYEVLRWNDMFPVVQEWVQVQTGFEYLFIGIVLLLVAAAVGNVALVASLSRHHEFGVMLAMGTTHANLRWLLIMESLMLSVLGTLAGLVLGYLLVGFVSYIGIDLSVLLGDTSKYYVDPVLRPRINIIHLIFTGSSVFLFSLLAGMYPAWSAGRLQPLEAISTHG